MENITRMEDMTLEEFTETLASSAPVPGGGGASALCGALGAALGNMVASLTIGKPKYADAEEKITTLKDKCSDIQKELLSYISRDAEGFAPLAKAYAMPRDTEEQILERGRVMERCLADACEVPLLIMDACSRALDCIEVFALLGSEMAISDAGGGAVICLAALKAASLNVFINTKSMKDRLEAQTINARAREILYIYEEKADRIYKLVIERLCKEQ